MRRYLKRWRALNKKMKAERFLWGELFQDDEWYQYMSFDLHKMQRARWDRITQATAEIAEVLQKTSLILDDIEFFIQLGVPISTYGLKKIRSSYFSYFTRLDLIVNEDEIKIIEINSDTPTGFLETAVANRIICEAHYQASPNHLSESIQAAWEHIKTYYNIKATDVIYFTAYRWHDEDRETAQFIRKHCSHLQTQYIDIADLVVNEAGVFTPQGDNIEFLYRLYPLEYLDDDIDEAGRNIGHVFLNHIAQGKLKIINPPSAFFMQSKAVMAIIYALFTEKSKLFTDRELAIIEQYFLPTYFDDTVFKTNKMAYVAKPIWGREGGGITLFDGDQKVIQTDKTAYYYNQDKIYQQYIEMPEITLRTWNGSYTGKLLVGSFLINSTPAGLFLRAGDDITGNLSMFLGVTVV